MKSKISFITLAVTDIKKSVAFYKNGFGFPTKGIQEGNGEHFLIFYKKSDDEKLV